MRSSACQSVGTRRVSDWRLRTNCETLRAIALAMKFLRLVLIALALAALAGCAVPRLASQFPPTDQRLTAPVLTGHSRVIVFNASLVALPGVDHTDRLQVLIDGHALGSLDRGEYAQVFLPPGRHDVTLRHRDIVWFETEHPLLIDRPVRWLGIRSEPMENVLDARDEPPAEFGKKYRPLPGR